NVHGWPGEKVSFSRLSNNGAMIYKTLNRPSILQEKPSARPSVMQDEPPGALTRNSVLYRPYGSPATPSARQKAGPALPSSRALTPANRPDID
ncbi:hypothetical protein, partial [Microvirga sp. 2TAF3]|uniref:hypothetical protein n=1 Tax=Microvirga sp. 2TAF3 TaxID=3233014 RepID=UPI003F9742E5